jgi:hypothetical protein
LEVAQEPPSPAMHWQEDSGHHQRDPEENPTAPPIQLIASLTGFPTRLSISTSVSIV